MNPRNQGVGVYRSGVAARLSGVPVDTLRIWEDIRRLAMIKQLVDSGHPIGTIASLDTDALLAMQTARWSVHETPPERTSAKERSQSTVVLVGPLVVGEQFVAALSSGALTVTGRCADLEQAVRALSDIRADIAIIDLPSMSDADLGLVTSIKAACRAEHAIVLYRFAPSATVRRMRMAGHAVARATTDPTEIEAICLGLRREPRLEADERLRWLEAAQPLPARFEEQFLAELSSASGTNECECPKHVCDLVLNLQAFERYSAECASRSPSDVLLHFELQRAAGLARSIMEQALERVAVAEGIELPRSAANL
jgi:MerR family transcriptional regulator, light-induced transcriptional regulator